MPACMLLSCSVPCKRLLGQLRLHSCRSALQSRPSASAGGQERTYRKAAVQRVAAAAKRSSASPDLRDRGRRPTQDQSRPHQTSEGHRQPRHTRQGDWRQRTPAKTPLEEQQPAQSYNRPPPEHTGPSVTRQHAPAPHRQPQPERQALQSPWQAGRGPDRAVDRQPLALRPQQPAPRQPAGEAGINGDWSAKIAGSTLQAQNGWQQQQQQQRQPAGPPWPQQPPAQARQRPQQQGRGFDADSFVRQQLSSSLPAATTFFVTCHPGLEACVEQELCSPRIGATRVVAARAGVYFRCAPCSPACVHMHA